MIRRVLRLLLCAIRHPSDLREHRGGIRCFACNPLRKHERKSYPLLEEHD